MITANAKELISIIGTEYGLQLDRCRGGHIKQSQMMPCLIERLQVKARTNTDLKIFLETIAYIHPHDDEHMDRDWAEDTRESHAQVVSNGFTRSNEQRARDEDMGCVPALVQVVPH